MQSANKINRATSNKNDEAITQNDFTLFDKLLTEINLKVWGLALPGSRVLEYATGHLPKQKSVREMLKVLDFDKTSFSIQLLQHHLNEWLRS